MNEHPGCTCADTHWDGCSAVPEHCSNNFIPTGWELEYESFNQAEPRRMVFYLTGRCLHCGWRPAKIGVLIPGDLTGDALFAHIYQLMETYRPFDTRFSNGAYRSRLPMRTHWYMEQDDLKRGEKNAQFLLLFHEDDQLAVEEWICRTHSEDPYTAPRRDRKSTLFHAVLDRARASGDLREIEPTAGHLWCPDYWESSGDLQNMQVKRVPGERRYHFFAPGRQPQNLFRIVSHDYPVLTFHLAVHKSSEECLHQYIFKNGGYHGGYCRDTGDAFAAIRKEMGFAP